MDSDSTSEENSSSECTSDSSDDDKLETAHVNGVRLQLPQGLCEHEEIFREFFSPDTWNSLSDAHKQRLAKLLPTFPENDEDEKSVTLEKLLGGEVFHFKSPLLGFHERLKAGHFRPDIARMRVMIKRAERREARHRYRSYRERLKRELLESRRKLLDSVRNLPPGVEPKVERLNGSCASVDPVACRTKRRYFQELGAIRSKVDETGFSSDENYPEGPPAPLSRKQKRLLNGIRSSHTLSGEKVFISSTASKPTGLDLEKYILPNRNPFLVNEDTYRCLLLKHKRRKVEFVDDDEIDTKGVTISDIVGRTKLPYVKKVAALASSASGKHSGSKFLSRKKAKREYFTHESSSQDVNTNKLTASLNQSSNSELDSDSDSYITAPSRPKPKPRTPKPPPKPDPKPPKLEPKPDLPDTFFPKTADTVTVTKSPYAQYGKITPATFSDLDGIDMMNLPIDLEDSSIDILELNNKPELMQETHASFLSLIRDIICSTSEHRMSMKVLEDRLRTWQENPISPLNDWYNISENWVDLLQSAINFLSGNFPEQPDDFVPYIEYKPQLDVHQWIGAGRDSDNSLSPLCQYWLDHRNEIKSPHKEKDDTDVEVMDRSQTPPPPRCPTAWTVRKAEPDDVKLFREQERRRYDNPHKAFTYRCNGYESVVGPLKGIYNPSQQQNTKARGHNMLSADRPNFVTILSLVRDATARLPNGEGTRAEICELLKSSQYISSAAPDNVLQSVVSGALDRMHTQFDPCVKYDQKRKIWIYLHRNRSEEDFERLHQQYQGMNRAVKKCSVKTRTPTKPKARVEKTPKNKNNVVVVNNSTPDKPKPTKSKPTATEPKPTPHSASNSPSLPKQQSVLLSNKLSTTKPDLPHLDSEALKPEMTSEDTTMPKKPTEKEEVTVVQCGSPLPSKQKSNKNFVKMISTNQGQPRSLIVPEQKASQQLVQTIVTQPKSSVQIVPKVGLISDVSGRKEDQKLPPSVQQQILQSLSSQNIKNVTLLRGIAQNPASSSETGEDIGHLVVQTSKPAEVKTQNVLTPIQQQQQQILQTLKQKVLPLQNAAVVNQQMLMKQKAAAQLQLQKHHAAPGTSLLGQPRVSAEGIGMKQTIMGASQSPVVAKVLTNAAGQVISVGNLLAHQKQHGSLPQGTTLRVSSSKTGQTNIIQLTSSQSASPHRVGSPAQFTVTSQNNYITLTSQPKLVVATQTTAAVTSTVTITKPVTKTATKTQTVAKMPAKVAQQLINAKFIAQSLDGQKIVMTSSKNVGNVNNKPVTLNVNSGAANAIRMVNAANLNLTHIGGKPVLLAGKGGTIQTLQGQNVILQPTGSGGGATTGNFIIQNAKAIADAGVGNVNLLGQNVVLAPQLKVQSPQVVVSSNVKTSLPTSGLVRLQTTGGGNATTQRLVLASSNQGGQIVAQQILLPAGFQGTAINIKALQGVKVIPIAQNAKNLQGRQVFARLVSPTANVVKTQQQQSGAPQEAGSESPVSMNK